jgi:hypothetical protein
MGMSSFSSMGLHCCSYCFSRLASLDNALIVSLGDSTDFFGHENAQVCPGKKVVLCLDGGALEDSTDVTHDSIRAIEEVVGAARTCITLAVRTAELDCAAIFQTYHVRKDLRERLRVVGAQFRYSGRLALNNCLAVGCGARTLKRPSRCVRENEIDRVGCLGEDGSVDAV